MKKPKTSFNKDAILDFLLRNVEKMIAAGIGLFACTLAWGGVDALRSMRPKAEQKPQTIVEQAKVTAEHIEAVKIAPDDELTSEKGLAAVVSKWLAPKIVPPPTPTILNKPLFGEVARRSKPEILPIEELHAVAGVTLIAAKPPAPAGRAAAERPPEPEAPAPGKGKPGRGRPGPNQPGGGMPSGSIDTAMSGMIPGMMPGSPSMPGMPGMPGMMPGMPGMPGDPAAANGKLVPYVLVTGLIPYAKQHEEFDRCFLHASLHDRALDTPRWTKYVIEKTEVLPGTAEKWTEVNLKNVVKQYSAEWARLQPEPLLATFTLPPDQERRESTKDQLPFCTPLPGLTDGAWALNALHPWFVDYMRKEQEKKRAEEEKQRRVATPDVFAGGAGPGFEGSPMSSPDMLGSIPGSPPMMDSSMMGSGMMGSGMMSGSGMMPGAPGMEGAAVNLGIENRLFRFIDLAVQPGRTYRYRVRLVARNPNQNLPNRHLADPALGKAATLDSPVSAPTSPVMVPDGRQLLVQPVKKADQKRLRPPQVPVYILGEQAKSPTFMLRALLMEPGGLANVDPKQNKKSNPTSRGEELASERVLLDVRGKVDDRAETRVAGKPTPPPEPLEMIFLRPDGTFEFASVAESQTQLERYMPTLAGDGGAAAAAGANPQAGFMDLPFGGSPSIPPGGSR